MVKCVIFDMDDTLYAEVEYCKSGFMAVAASIAAGPKAQQLYQTLWNEFASGNHTRTFNAALDKCQISYDKEFILDLVKTYRCHQPSIKLPDQSRAVLETLETEYKLALLTDGFMPAQQLKVRALDIEKYFQSIVYTEQLGREFWKPSPVGFEKIIKDLSVKGDECVYIADNLKKDFIAPNMLGFVTIQLILPDKSHHDKAPDDTAKPQHVISSITDLLPLLRKI